MYLLCSFIMIKKELNDSEIRYGDLILLVMICDTLAISLTKRRSILAVSCPPTSQSICERRSSLSGASEATNLNSLIGLLGCCSAQWRRSRLRDNPPSMIITETIKSFRQRFRRTLFSDQYKNFYSINIYNRPTHNIKYCIFLAKVNELLL